MLSLSLFYDVQTKGKKACFDINQSMVSIPIINYIQRIYAELVKDFSTYVVFPVTFSFFSKYPPFHEFFLCYLNVLSKANIIPINKIINWILTLMTKS